jgi:hypothetical protein
VFWIVLGLASAAGAADPEPAVAADLPSGAPADEVAASLAP